MVVLAGAGCKNEVFSGAGQGFIAELTFFFAYICLMAGHFLSVLQQLVEWDRWLFLMVNRQHANSFFDWILPYFRDAVFWAPLYLFLIILIGWNFGKQGWFWCLGLICTVAITDMISARLVKEYIERPRPCWDPEFFQHVRLVVRSCVHSFSFTSNHAANHFGLASFIALTLLPVFGRWVYLIFLWAFLVAYSQVYVGVHYPLDVMGGALLGLAAGLLTATIFNKRAGTFILTTKNPQP
jgi:undecaprenyl-diphosphatase